MDLDEAENEENIKNVHINDNEVNSNKKEESREIIQTENLNEKYGFKKI